MPIVRCFVLTCLLVGGLVSLASAENPNVVQRGNLGNARLKFARDKVGRVAFMGGSITEMEGYRPMVAASLRGRFPDTKFTFINAGISSTCSTTGAFRLATDVLAAGSVDLLFIEFAVNDDQDAAHTREECIRGLEGIIRHARRDNPLIDIIVTYFVNEGMLAAIGKGEVPLTIASHEAVAKHYDVSTVNLAKEVSDQMAAGNLTWQKYGGVHPAPHGNSIAAGLIDELLGRAWTKPLASDVSSTPHALPETLDPLNYERGRFIDPAQAKIAEGWKLFTPNWKELKGSSRSRFTNIPMLCADEPQAELSLEFTGTAIGAYIVAGPDAGLVEARIDGGQPVEVNLLHRYSAGLHYPRTVMFATDLAPEKHTLVLRMTDRTKSAGHAMRIMQFTAD
jgi:lysophospholipase L1-like esterase